MIDISGRFSLLFGVQDSCDFRTAKLPRTPLLENYCRGDKAAGYLGGFIATNVFEPSKGRPPPTFINVPLLGSIRHICWNGCFGPEAALQRAEAVAVPPLHLGHVVE